LVPWTEPELPGEPLMHGHENCTFYNNGVTKCLDCDGIIEIDFMCVHGIHQPKAQNGCTCNNKSSGGKHRKK
jgi:hypothetical protein